ncbi:MAG: metal ABC transporter substrate-binding protein [Bdellovibrionales bacterium]|jgi:zinc/manganese transport system substrate-binding protein
MKKNILLCLFFFSSFVLAPVFAEAKPLSVVATFSILGDLVKQVGGDDVDVKTLVGPDGDAHAYKPTPKDSKALAEADLVIENGLGFEGWVSRLVSASGFKGSVIIASKGVVPRQMDEEGKQIIDPHAWQDVSNTRIYIKNIASALGKALPEKAGAFNARAKAYDAELEKLDAWVKSEIGQIPEGHRKIITSHDAFGYFAAAYGVAFISPQGISTEVEPTARQVAKLIGQMKAEKIKRVFFESMASPKLISQLAKDAGASVGKPVYSDALSDADGSAETYIDMFRTNVEQFKEAMLLNGK